MRQGVDLPAVEDWSVGAASGERCSGRVMVVPRLEVRRRGSCVPKSGLSTLRLASLAAKCRRWRLGNRGDLVELAKTPKSTGQARLQSPPACAPEARTGPHEFERERVAQRGEANERESGTRPECE